ncbi:MAG: hypothetical protein ABH879_05615 [archaeon]
MIEMETDIAPRTKDDRHELVFPRDFRQNHGIPLRAALEGRVTLELLRTPSAGHRLIFENSYSAEDGDGVLEKVSVPYLGVMEKSKRLDQNRHESDSFIPPYTPIFSYDGHCDLTPLNMDSSRLKGSRFMWGMSDALHRVPEVGDYRYLLENDACEKFYSAIDQLRAAGDYISDIRPSELGAFLVDVSRLHIIEALYVARVLQEDPEAVDLSDRHYSNGSGTLRACIVQPSRCLTRRIANSAEALCREYLSETEGI